MADLSGISPTNQDRGRPNGNRGASAGPFSTADRSAASANLVLGRYPTPVYRAEGLDLEHGELWVKDDGVTSELYGGNKVRKLELFLAEAVRRGSRRVVTVGAAGSHHVLATTVFSRQLGLKAAAVLCPQPWSEHAEQVLRAALGAGLEAHPVGSVASVAKGEMISSLPTVLALFVTIRCPFIKCCLHPQQRLSSRDPESMNNESINTVGFIRQNQVSFHLILPTFSMGTIIF